MTAICPIFLVRLLGIQICTSSSVLNYGTSYIIPWQASRRPILVDDWDRWAEMKGRYLENFPHYSEEDSMFKSNLRPTQSSKELLDI
jgi:hypothetical protein